MHDASAIAMQAMPPDFAAIVYAVPIQFLSYYTAVAWERMSTSPVILPNR